ncbi:MAG: hypothetical protein M3032_11280 [Verrucomicrobiota bacterium]|nr:hypothetical protein [Verrucomicrobiota bacterium]
MPRIPSYSQTTTFKEAFGDQYLLNNPDGNPPPKAGLNTLHRWNTIAVDATGLDHTPTRPGEPRTFGEQLGPGRSSRAMAIVHIAIFDAVNAITGADQTHLNTVQLSRLLALVNVAMADAGMASWDSKFYWDMWRPVTGIRESDLGTGPSGLGDDNPATIGNPTFTPLGARSAT